MKKKHRILIIEDHRILREGLKSLLDSNPNFEISGEGENGLDAIRWTEKIAPDLILMDLSMPKMDGLAAIAEIKSRCRDTKILVLTVHKAEEYVFAALKAGANGYLLKDATHAELELAIENILNDNMYLSSAISGKLVQAYLEGKKPEIVKHALEGLTRRERQVLKLIAEGNKNREIAGYLGISLKTVEKHRSNLMKKLDLHNASELTAFAIEKGLVTI